MFGANFVPGLVLRREDTAGNQTDKHSCPHRGCVLDEEDGQPPSKENVSYVKYYGAKLGQGGGSMIREGIMILGMSLDLEA